jgi:hypothetical protein
MLFVVLRIFVLSIKEINDLHFDKLFRLLYLIMIHGCCLFFTLMKK